MSLPLLQTSPSVQLEVGTDRQLRADAVLSPNPTNALKVRDAGLYAKAGQRTYPWNISINTARAVTLATQVNQVLNWNVEDYDPLGMTDLVVQPTRVTIPADGRYFTRATATVQLTGGTAVAGLAMFMILKNGSAYQAGDTSMETTAAGVTTFVGNIAAWLDLKAGDYIECYWRWLAFTTLTATAAALQTTTTTRWQGWSFQP